MTLAVIPAKAGIQSSQDEPCDEAGIPAFAGMTSPKVIPFRSFAKRGDM
jgi:hypothetical protein